jgi:DNA-binding CsgD family transcriptional regulator
MWMLGRPADAAQILADLAEGAEDPAEQAERLAVEACADAVAARCEDAAEKARKALDSGELSDFHAMIASVAMVMALGALGRPDELEDIAERATNRAAASFEASHMRFWFGGVHARACRLTGRIDDFARSAQRLADSQKEVPGLAYANLALVLGNADLARGNLGSAVTLLHEALAGAEKHGVTTGLRPASCFSLAEAHAKLGQTAAAQSALAEAKRAVPQGYLFMHTGLAIATGWTLAAGGLLSDAVAVVRAAERDARERHQPTHELACLQAATLWGDPSGAARAREVADATALPLGDLIACHAEALAAGDGTALLDVSIRYRKMGDRTSAADAAAQAAVAYAGAQHSSRSRYATAQAQELAQECGGLCTPALRIPAVPVRLTGRQREIAELVGTGLSNREIADRLHTSLRTVEGHLYRACKRVGASSRTELAAIMRAGPAGRR